MWKTGVLRPSGDFAVADWSTTTASYLAGIKAKANKHGAIIAALEKEKVKVAREDKEEKRKALLKQREEEGLDSDTEQNAVVQTVDHRANLPDSDDASEED